MKKSAALRGLFKRERVIRLVGAHDGLSAKLIQEHGFDGIWASGFEISASYAVPDANILTMTQYLERACEMDEATSVPVVADCDTGYGNSSNAIHMVKQYEGAGIAGVCIEDKRFPKLNSFIPDRQELAPIAEFVGKLMACKQAQLDPDFLLIARIEALIAGCGEQEALRRAHAYVDAGADAILIHSKAKTPDEIRSFCRQWKRRAPVVVIPTTYPELRISEMQDLGIAMVIYANQGVRAAIKAMHAVFSRIKEADALTTIGELVVPIEEVFRLQGMTQMREAEQRYRRDEREAISAIIPAAGDRTYEPSFKEILASCPVSMLDINGKPLLMRNRETLNACGIFNITVIRGFQADRVDVEGLRYLENPAYDTTRQIDSILLAEAHVSERNLIIFSDVLFEKAIIQKLLDTHDDIVLVIDRSAPRKRSAIDYVYADGPPMRAGRSLSFGKLHTVLKIGKGLTPREEAFEFTGISLFSRRGFQAFKQAYAALKAQSDAAQPDMLTGLQHLIDGGTPVCGLEVRDGWIEIRSLENYRTAHGLFASGRAQA